MALSTQVFTPGNPPDHSAALTQIALNRPDVFKAFSQGYDQAQQRQIKLQQYREAKLKADLAEQLYPDLLRSQQAMLQARMSAIQNPTQYAASPSAVTPVDTRRNTTAPVNGPAAVTNPVPVQPQSYNPDNPFNGPAQSLLQTAPQPQPMIPGLAGDTTDYGSNVAEASPYNSDDFLA